MNRTFSQFTIVSGGTPQPVVGTYISATTAPGTPDPQGETLTILPVGSSAMFLVGDYALIQTITYTVPEWVRVQKVPDGTHITVKGLANTRTGGAFGTGDFVSLAIPVSRTYVQDKPGNTGNIFIGTVGMSKSTLVKVIAQLVPFTGSTQPIEYSDTRFSSANTMNSSDLWLDGTTADAYQPSFGIT